MEPIPSLVLPDLPCLKDLRISRNLTLRQVEQATGISNSYLSQLETGKITNPSYHLIKLLLDYYYVTK